MPTDNRTEPGTARKRERAREQGQVPRGRDLPGAAAMLAAIGAIALFTHSGLQRWQLLYSHLLSQAAYPGGQIGLAQYRAVMLAALTWTAPVVGFAWLAGAAVSMQGGVVVAFPSLLKFDRLVPGRSLKAMFSAAGLSRTGRSILPISVIGYFTFVMLMENWSALMRASDMPVPNAMRLLVQMLLSLCWRAGLVLVAWAGVDYVLQRRNYESTLRMTREEVKDEGKQTVGNPQTRGRIRRLQRQMHRRRMMRDVPTATVVITNPTEYAIALRYVPEEMAAPIVVAKGRNLLAQAIRRLALWNDVPIVENVPLAHALYRNVEIGHPIPGKLYAAVAEIMAYIFRAQRRRPQAMTPLPRIAGVSDSKRSQ